MICVSCGRRQAVLVDGLVICASCLLDEPVTKQVPQPKQVVVDWATFKRRRHGRT